MPCLEDFVNMRTIVVLEDEEETANDRALVAERVNVLWCAMSECGVFGHFAYCEESQSFGKARLRVLICLSTRVTGGDTAGAG